jgi:hypothetical protein
MEAKWYQQWDQRNSLLTVCLQSVVHTVSDDDGDSDPYFRVGVHFTVAYTRECMRFGWEVMSDDQREAFGVQFQDPTEVLWYKGASDTVFWCPATRLCTLTRPVYEFRFVEPPDCGMCVLVVHVAGRHVVCRCCSEYYGAIEFQRLWRGKRGRRSAFVRAR